jgi:hypothetical protein
MIEREQFEADWSARHHGLPINNRMRDDGQYAIQAIQAAWETWQATRAQPAQAVPVLSVMEAIHIGAKHSTGLSHTREFTEDSFLACVAEIEQAVRAKTAEANTAPQQADAVPVHQCTGAGDTALGTKSECSFCSPQQAEAVPSDVVRDAERYRWLRDKGFAYADVDLGSDFDEDTFVSYRIKFNVPEPAHYKFEDDEWTATDIDAAIDAAIAAQGEKP